MSLLWPTATRKNTMLEELDKVLVSLKIRGCLDTPPFAPGVRKGVCLAHISARDAEGPQDLTRGDALGRQLSISGQLISAVSDDQGLSVMGLALRPGLTALDAVSQLVHKARKKFWACRDLLLSHAPLRRRIALLYRTVWGCMAWVIGAFMPSSQSLHFLNSFLYTLLVQMCHIKRRPGELFVDFKARSLRTARYLLQQSGFERWSTMHLRLAWRYAGHRSRGILLQTPGAAACLTHFRTPEWWLAQQSIVTGLRHKRRHYPRITLEERMLSSVFKGQDWRPHAEHRGHWKSLECEFVRLHDCSWASLQQLALEG